MASVPPEGARGKCLQRRHAEIQAEGSAAILAGRPERIRTEPRRRPAHLSGFGGSSSQASRNAARFETVPSGNSVTLEDEMTKLADTQARLPDRRDPLHQEHLPAEDRHRQTGLRIDHGLHALPGYRGFRTQGPGRPDPDHLREYRQCGLHFLEAGRRSLPAQNPDLPRQVRPGTRSPDRRRSAGSPRTRRLSETRTSPGTRAQTRQAT